MEDKYIVYKCCFYDLSKSVIVFMLIPRGVYAERTWVSMIYCLFSFANSGITYFASTKSLYLDMSMEQLQPTIHLLYVEVETNELSLLQKH